MSSSTIVARRVARVDRRRARKIFFAARDFFRRAAAPTAPGAVGGVGPCG
jgi:hypothetical protein